MCNKPLTLLDYRGKIIHNRKIWVFIRKGGKFRMLNTALAVTQTAAKAATEAAKEDLSVMTVILLGMGIVFLGLICIVILCVMVGKVIRLLEGKQAPAEAASAPVAPAAPVAVPVAEIPNRAELVAAISCCIAEELGTDVEAIRILSLKKI